MIVSPWISPAMTSAVSLAYQSFRNATSILPLRVEPSSRFFPVIIGITVWMYITIPKGMFPIQDIKGRVIAFGGRALEADVPAKYLNSPETPLFHKGAILFNAARGRV